MKARVNSTACIGCGLCEAVCPSVFHLENGLSTVVADPVPPEARDACRAARDACPVGAITLDEEAAAS